LQQEGGNGDHLLGGRECVSFSDFLKELVTRPVVAGPSAHGAPGYLGARQIMVMILEQAVIGSVHLSYDPYFLAYFSSRNSISVNGTFSHGFFFPVRTAFAGACVY